METRIKEYSVGQLARLSGVTVRTLHHYDSVGLLHPAHVATNGYRTYGRTELLRLQEILYYRAFGMSLADIAAVLDDGSAIARLTAHRARLATQAAQANALLETLDRTIATLTKDTNMTDQDLYAPFDAETQTAHENWLVETYGPEMAAVVSTSKEAVASLPDGIAGAMEDLREIETQLVEAFAGGAQPGDNRLVEMLETHRAFMTRMWGQDCSAQAYAGLADMYLSHPDFVSRYERLAPQFSQWLPRAMKAYADVISA